MTHVRKICRTNRKDIHQQMPETHRHKLCYAFDGKICIRNRTINNNNVRSSTKKCRKYLEIKAVNRQSNQRTNSQSIISIFITLKLIHSQIPVNTHTPNCLQDGAFQLPQLMSRRNKLKPQMMINKYSSTSLQESIGPSILSKLR